MSELQNLLASVQYKHEIYRQKSLEEQISEIHSRKIKLNDIKAQLKTEFYGIDHVIDRVMTAMQSWYLMPSTMKKPLIISLWGMTGVGKTSLVTRLADLLEMNKNFIYEDLTEFTSSERFQRSILDKAWPLSYETNIFLFDEFHTVRTIDGSGADVDRPMLKELWNLLDTGKILKHNIEFANMRNSVNERMNAFKIYGSQENYAAFYATDLKWIFESIGLLTDSIEQICELGNKNPVELAAWLYGKIKTAENKSLAFDFTRSLVFISGNLDEAFPDYQLTPAKLRTLDDLHSKTSLITSDQIKKSLLYRFRPEQLSRLGNIVIPFPSLNFNTAQKILKKRLSDLSANLMKDYHIPFTVSDVLLDTLILEGAIPAQGARPLLSFFDEQISAQIGNWVVHYFENKIEKIHVDLDATKQFLLIQYYQNNQITTTQTEKIRFPQQESNYKMPSYLKKIITVHEVGHIVAGACSIGMLPEKVYFDQSPFAAVIYPDYSIITKHVGLQKINLMLGGLVAEQLVFGQDHFSNGASKDLLDATQLCLSMIGEYGMGNHVAYSMPTMNTPATLTSWKKADDEYAHHLLEECKTQVVKMIQDQWSLFTHLIEHASLKGELSTANVKALFMRHFQGSEELKTSIASATAPLIFTQMEQSANQLTEPWKKAS